MIDFQLILDSLPALLQGAVISLQIAIFAACIGFIIGTLLAFGETSKNPIIRFFVRAYVTLFRGTPMLIQILFIFYLLPQLGVKIPPVWSASLAIGLNSGAYISQIIQTGIGTISKGQIEAAQTLGLSKFLTMRHIILPHAFKSSLPTLGNELITLVKDSSLASVIGVMELTKEASVIRSRTYDAFSIFLAVTCIYLILTASLSWGVKKLEGALKDV